MVYYKSLFNFLQANYGGIRVNLPKALRDVFDEEGEEEEEDAEEQKGEGQGVELSQEEEGDADEDHSEPMEEDGAGQLDETWGDVSFNREGPGDDIGGVKDQNMELQMNWNICRYLPEDGSCQNSFQVCEIGVISETLV